LVAKAFTIFHIKCQKKEPFRGILVAFGWSQRPFVPSLFLIDVMAQRGANIDSDHMLVVIKLRARICRAKNTKQQQLRRFTVDSRRRFAD
jgi:hypothetical protein